MFRTAAGVAAAALVSLPLGLGACAPIRSTHGFQVVETKPADIKVGEDTKSTVLEKLGSPSAASTFEPNNWFYMSQSVEQKAFFRPRVTQREVVAIAFGDDEKVKSVNTYTLADGKVIAFNGRKTPTRGRELTILEQLLGNVGRGSMLPRDQDDDTPAGRRRE